MTLAEIYTQKGIQLGLEQGRQQGIQQYLQQVAQKMLAGGYDDALIIELTGIDVTSLKDLKKEEY